MIWKRAIRRLSYCVLACLAVFGLAAAEHHGQVKFGGLPVPGATVTAMQGDKKLVAVTDSQGAYSFPDLPDGVWTIQVEMLCFETLKQDVGVAPNAPSPTWELKLLPLDQMKAVMAAAPAPAATTATAATAREADDKKRSSAPPAKASPANSQTGFQRTDVNASPDAAPADLASAAVDPNANASDAFVLNGSVSNRIESRAIGNARRGARSMYNGNLFFVMDDSVLDARSFSLTGHDTPQPSYNHLQLGGSFGGPLYIPHVLRSNGQFFVGYQMVRNRNASTASGLMPTEEERNGDFADSKNALGQPIMIFDPNTNTLGNMIPSSEISSQVKGPKGLLALYPMPGFAQSAGYNYQIPIVGKTNSDSVMSRVNRILNSKNFVNGSFAYQRSDTSSPNILGFLDTTQLSGFNASATYRHMFSTRFNGSLTYQFSRASTRVTPFFANREDVAGNAGIKGNDQNPLNWGPPALNFLSSGIQQLSDAQQSFTRNQTSALGYNGLWMPRPHNITFGADFRRQQFNSLAQADPRGTFGFTGAATEQIVNGVHVPETGSDFADFLLGIPDTSSIAFGNADKYFRSNLWDAFVNDDWRIGPTLTLNVGMRWDYGSPITELYGRLVNLDIAPGFAAEAPVLASSPVGPLTGQRYPGSLVRPDKHEFQPRVAFAWHPLAGSSMVVRGGYGVYYNTSVYQTIANTMAQQSQFSKSLSVSNSAADPLTLADGFPSPASAPKPFAIDPDFRVGYAQNWQLSVQKDVTDSTVMTLTYLGVKGTRGVQEFLPNTYPADATDPCPTCPAGYTYMTSNGNSTRESGQIQLRRRMHNGFAASGQYTFSHSFDDAAMGGRGQGAAVIAQNWLDLSAERGPSNFDQRHALSATAQYTTGMGLGGGTLMGGWLGRLVKGWTFITTATAGTGLPETPIYSIAVRNTGVTGSIRPDATGISVNSPVPGRHLNPAAFQAPAPGQWGNAGRNSLTGPAQFSLNASMGRSFNRVDLRFDATNALNHVTYPSWNATITNAQFGLPMSANAMRVLQATLRVRF